MGQGRGALELSCKMWVDVCQKGGIPVSRKNVGRGRKVGKDEVCLREFGANGEEAGQDGELKCWVSTTLIPTPRPALKDLEREDTKKQEDSENPLKNRGTLYKWAQEWFWPERRPAQLDRGRMNEERNWCTSALPSQPATPLCTAGTHACGPGILKSMSGTYWSPALEEGWGIKEAGRPTNVREPFPRLFSSTPQAGDFQDHFWKLLFLCSKGWRLHMRGPVGWREGN